MNGNLVRFVLLPGHRFDTVGVPPLIDDLTFGGFIADKAFDPATAGWAPGSLSRSYGKSVRHPGNAG